MVLSQLKSTQSFMFHHIEPTNNLENTLFTFNFCSYFGTTVDCIGLWQMSIYNLFTRDKWMAMLYTIILHWSLQCFVSIHQIPGKLIRKPPKNTISLFMKTLISQSLLCSFAFGTCTLCCQRLMGEGICLEDELVLLRILLTWIFINISQLEWCNIFWTNLDWAF